MTALYTTARPVASRVFLAQRRKMRLSVRFALFLHFLEHLTAPLTATLTRLRLRDLLKRKISKAGYRFQACLISESPLMAKLQHAYLGIDAVDGTDV